MITGLVNASLEAIVPIEVIAVYGSTQLHRALIDTGFDGELLLPTNVLRGLNWPERGRRTAILGDGTRTAFNTSRGSILWNGAVRAIHVLEGAHDPIVGMRLLGGTRVTMDVVENGAVQINPLGDADGGTLDESQL